MTPTPSFRPALILHGGAGNIHRSTLPPDLYAKYHTSLLTYLRSTKHLLDNGAHALDAAVHAVSLMEDNELFNCGRGSVFTSAGTIEMEASVMVTSVGQGESTTESTERNDMKRGAGVIALRNVRHPVQLAREVLLRTGQDVNGDPLGDDDGTGSMHCQLSGPYVEELARGWGVEFQPDEWFWTRRRWEEHRRGLGKMNLGLPLETGVDMDVAAEAAAVTMSQGTVGCVCLDQWGNLAVATSTGGLTNKLPGRVGDTPTLGAGFWAEAWDVEADDNDEDTIVFSPRHPERKMQYVLQSQSGSEAMAGAKSVWDMTLADCFPAPSMFFRGFLPTPETAVDTRLLPPQRRYDVKQPPLDEKPPRNRGRRRRRRGRRAVAVSGTGNGDSFLRTAAARTACAMTRFSSQDMTLADAITAVAGPRGELQRSAGQRWGKTGEGMGGIIGIEADGAMDASGLRRGNVVFDFNCGGMFRAWVEEGADGRDIENVMVFKEPYL